MSKNRPVHSIKTPPFYRTWQHLSDLLLPRRCVACTRPCTSQAQPSHPHAGHSAVWSTFLCEPCRALAQAASTVRCTDCGLRLGPRLQAFGWTRCRHCKADPPATHHRHAVVCCDYTAPFDQWIAHLKYGKAHGLAPFLGAWLADALTNRPTPGPIPKPDLLVPVPCHTAKLGERGYNQAALIARAASKHLNTPVCTRLLKKTKPTQTQADLSRADRLANLDGAFQATRAIDPALTIGLIDDVITTGATLQRCEETLVKAGARSIILMAICRTPE
jgi:ComF family protein